MNKGISRTCIVLAVVSSLTMSSCIGKFALTNKLLTWNRTIGNKFVNELVFFAFWILPVYEVSALADILVINSIEFWSGSNPVASGTKVIKGENDNYLVECDGKGYTITSESDKQVVRLDFNEDMREWDVTVDGQTYPLMTFVDDTHVALPSVDGASQIVSLDEAGLTAYKQTVSQLSPMAVVAR